MSIPVVDIPYWEQVHSDSKQGNFMPMIVFVLIVKNLGMPLPCVKKRNYLPKKKTKSKFLNLIIESLLIVKMFLLVKINVYFLKNINWKIR